MQNEKFTKPFPVQAQCWASALSGYDVLGVAPTGSGKTLGYLLPAVMHLQGQLEDNKIEVGGGPIVLILSPTRELALQVFAQCNKLKPLKMNPLCIYGGLYTKLTQSDTLEENSTYNTLVATPGRLLDFIFNGEITLKNVSYFVLDEADKMLSLGFFDQVNKISKQIRPDKQVLMFSATFPHTVEQAASTWLKDPIKISLADTVATIPSTITQIVNLLKEHKKKKEIGQIY